MAIKHHGKWLASWYENGKRKRKAFDKKATAQRWEKAHAAKKSPRPLNPHSRKSSGANQSSAKRKRTRRSPRSPKATSAASSAAGAAATL